jgi:hypothetical protein
LFIFAKNIFKHETKKRKGEKAMRPQAPLWFIYFIGGLILALLICLFLLPATAQPSGTTLARQFRFVFPRI